MILTCPFCRTENKARKDAEHVVCYKCHNSVSIFHENKNKASSGFSNINPYDQMNPPNKSMRSNEMFFPQPGPYNHPNSQPHFPFPPYNYPPFPNPYAHDPVDRQMENYLRMEMLKKKIERKEPRPQRFSALRDLINTVEQINDTRSNGATPILNKRREYSSYERNDRNNFESRSLVSPLRSDSVYKNIFSNKVYVDPYDSYQNFKKNKNLDKLNLDTRDYVLK